MLLQCPGICGTACPYRPAFTETGADFQDMPNFFDNAISVHARGCVPPSEAVNQRPRYAAHGTGNGHSGARERGVIAIMPNGVVRPRNSSSDRPKSDLIRNRMLLIAFAGRRL